MSTQEKPEKTPDAGTAKPIRKPRGPQGPRPPAGSRDAKRVAAAILEVLGGVWRPGEAASTLAVTLPRYYQLEARALEGLVLACEPRSKGRGPRRDQPERELVALKQEVVRLRQESARYAALMRASQRAAGLPTPPPSKAETGKRKKRKPAVRALLAVKRLAVDAAPAVGPERVPEARPV